MNHFDPNTSLTDLSHNLNNLNPEAGEVNTLSNEFVKVFNDTLNLIGSGYRYACGSWNLKTYEYATCDVTVTHE